MIPYIEPRWIPSTVGPLTPSRATSKTTRKAAGAIRLAHLLPIRSPATAPTSMAAAIEASASGMVSWAARCEPRAHQPAGGGNADCAEESDSPIGPGEMQHAKLAS